MLPHQDGEAFLIEVAVVGEDFGYVRRLHDIHGYAILEAVALIEATGVEIETLYEGFVRLLDDLYARVVHNAADSGCGPSPQFGASA